MADHDSGIPFRLPEGWLVPFTLRHRLTALAAGIVVLAATLVPAVPAFAEDPTPAPVATAPAEAPTPEPTALATPEPTATPTPEPTATAAPEPTPEPTETAIPTPTPTPMPTGFTDPIVLYTGVLGALSADGAAGYNADVQVLDVAGLGLLLVDTSGVDLERLRLGTVRLSLAVPAGLALASDPTARFDQLATYSSSEAPLVAESATPGKQLIVDNTSAMVDQTPNNAAVHQVYAVLVTPSNGTKDSSQTAANVQTAITNASTYWSNQSGGSITFNLAGTTSWYASANACTSSAGSTALWNEARDVARTQLGYTAAKNTHLVLFFPPSQACGGALGLGTIGWSVNQGGLAWVLGTTSPSALQSTAHELGHNMSLGHATWGDCTTADPHPGYPGNAGCTLREYGDLTDIMGFSTSTRTGGALSAAQAIRASIWPSSAWVQATTGTNSYDLAPVSGHTGVRGVVVQDTNGVNYFVEFRTFTGEDAQYSGAGCGASACVATASGVRILRIEQDQYFYQGLPGDDSIVYSRVVGGVKKINYGLNEIFNSTGTPAGITVKVTALSAASATVEVTMPVQGPTAPDAGGLADFVEIAPTIYYDSQPRVGDTWTAFYGDWWTAATYSFQWKSGGVTVGTSRSYTLTAADITHTVELLMTGTTSTGSVSTYAINDIRDIQPPGYQPSDPGAVGVSNVSSTLSAVFSSWPSGTSFTCQWIRETTGPFMSPVSGATNCFSYPLSAADRGKDIAVQATATVPWTTGNYAPVMRQSVSKDYTITAAGPVFVLGTPKVGVPLSVADTVYSTVDGSITPDLSYTWFRNGVQIATGPNYTPVAADYNTRLSVRVDAAKAGYISYVGVPSALSALVALGDIPTTGDPTITVGATQLLASAASASSTEPGISAAYQWVRVNPTTLVETVVAATQNYTPVQADWGQNLKVKLTLTKPNYTPRVLSSNVGDYSLYLQTSPVLSGASQVGLALAISDVAYRDVFGTPLSLTAPRTYQWFRNGVAIVGATGMSYQLQSVDFGTTVTVKVTAKSDPYAPIVTTVTAPPVQKGVFVGTLAAGVSIGTALKLTAQPTGITAPTGVITYSYQWFRQTGAAAPVPIAGQVLATYTLTAADYNTRTFVRITATNPNYANAVADSVPHTFSIVAEPLVPVLVGEQRLGVDLVVGPRTYTAYDSPATPEVTYAWFRDGVAIPGTSGVGDAFRHYTPTAADAGKSVSVTVTATGGGFISSTGTSIPTQKLTAFSIDGWDAPLPDVVQTPGTLKLTLPGTGITDPAATIAYQWLRNGAAIAGATAATYTLTAADLGTLVSVRVTAAEALYTSIVKTSPGIDYSIQSVSTPTITSSLPTWQVGATGSITGLSFVTKDGPLTGQTYTYQWLRNGVAIPTTGLAATYEAVAVDLATTTSVRITVNKPGYLPLTVTSTATPAVTKGDLAGSFVAPTVTVSATNLLTAVPTAGAITTPGVTYTYQWLRDGAVALGAAATYQLVAADAGHTVSVRLTGSKLNYNNAVLPTSAALDYAIVADGPVTVSNNTNFGGAPRVGDDLVATLPNFSTKEGSLAAPVVTYQWFKKAGTAAPVAIIGATGAHYIVASSDFGATVATAVTLSVQVNVAAPTYLALKQTSAQTAAVGMGIITGTRAAPTVVSSATGLLSVVLTPGSIDMPSPTLSYKWYRVGSPDVLLATTTTYQLTAANAEHLIYVVVTASKANATPAAFELFFSSPATNYSLKTTGGVAVMHTEASPRIGDTLSLSIAPFTDGSGNSITPTLTYQWYAGSPTLPRFALTNGTGPTYTIPYPMVPLNITVVVTAKYPGLLPLVLTSPPTPAVVPGTIDAAANAPVVTLTNATTLDYTASLPPGTITTPGTTLTYKWYRNGTTVVGTAATYRLVAADAGQSISASITATKPGFTNRDFGSSTGVNYAILAGGPTTLSFPSASPGVGEAITAVPPTFTDVSANPITPTFSYQWLRKVGAGAFTPIAGPLGTGPNYAVVAADVSAPTQFQVIVTAKYPGLIPLTLPSSASSPIAVPGTLTVTPAIPIVTLTNGATNIYTASLPGGTVTTPATTLGYQWYRDGAMIAGQVAANYALVAADAGKAISVGIKVSKPGYTTVDLGRSPNVNYTPVVVGFAPGVVGGGALQTGAFLSGGTGLAWQTATGDPLPVTTSYQWYRKFGAATAAVPGATGATYELSGNDINMQVYVIVTAKAPGFIPATSSSLATPLGPVVTQGPIQGTFDGATVVPNGVSSLKVSFPAGFLVTTGTTISYQWKRDGNVISGATLPTYTLTTLDTAASLITVDLLIKKANLLPAIGQSATNTVGRDPRITPVTAPSINGTPLVGRTLTADVGAFTDANGVATTATVQWMRKTNTATTFVAIPGATGLSYVIPPTDLNVQYRLSVTPTAPGSIGAAAFSGDSAIVGKGTFEGTLGQPVVTLNPTTFVLAATLPAGTITTPAPTLTYQWLREGVVIPGAVAATYTLAAADVQRLISVRVTANKLQFDTAVLPESNPIDYSVYRNASTSNAISGLLQVGRTLTFGGAAYVDRGGNPLATPKYTYVWTRQFGAAAPVAIAGATTSTYTLTSADLGAKIAVKLIIGATGYLGLAEPPVGTLTATDTVQLGVFQGGHSSPMATLNPATNTLTASMPIGSVTDPTPTFSYQWMRNNVPIAGGVGPTYKLTPADYDTLVYVRVTVSKVGYITSVPGVDFPDSTGENYGISYDVPPVLQGSMQVGTTAAYSTTNWTLRGANVSPTFRYEWLRDGVVIPGFSAATYVLQAADVGKLIRLRITPSYPGGIGVPFTTSGATVSANNFTGSFAVPIVTEFKPTMTLTATLPAGSINESGLTAGFQWLRDGAPIAGATTATYKLVEATDRNKNITVRYSFSKPGYNPAAPLDSNGHTYTFGAALSIQITPASTPAVGDLLQLSAAGYDYTPSSVTYQWYRKTGSGAGVPIIGTLGANPTYIVTAADTGSSIYAVITGSYAGYFPNIQTTSPLAVPGVPWAGSFAPPTVSLTASTMTLTATLPVGSITSTPFASAHQWYRDSLLTPIVGQTLATYKLTAADAGHLVFVRLTATKPLYDALVLDSASVDYSITRVDSPAITWSAAPDPALYKVGSQVSVPASVFTDGLGNPQTGVTVTYQWFRNGAAIAGTNASTYVLAEADYNMTISVSITAAKAGYLSYVRTVAAPQVVGKGDISFVTGAGASLNASSVITATNGTVNVAGATLTRTWLRNGTAFTVAGQTYTLNPAADYNKTFIVRFTYTKSAAYNPLVFDVDLGNLSVVAAGKPTIDPNPTVGQILTVTPGDPYTSAGVSGPASGYSNVQYQWYVGGVAVAAAAGGTAATFEVPGTASTKTISVSLKVPSGGLLPSIERSVETNPVP